MRNKLLSGLVALAIIGVSAPQSFAVGEAGVPSLIIPPGARANGIGESYVALAEDATAAWWNPGGLAFVNGHNLALMHSQLVPDLANDVYYEFLGYTNQLSDFGTIGVSLVYLTYGTSVATNAQGIPQGEFKSWEASGLVSFALPLTPNLGVGLTGKFIHADLAPASLTLEHLDGTGSSVAVDMGLLWKVPAFHIPVVGNVVERRLRLGASLTNLGPDISFIDQEQSDPLPFTARVGFAYTAVADEVSNLLFTGDIEQSLVWLIDSGTNKRRSEIWHGGIEYRYIDLLAGRIGYVYDKDGDFNSATYGLGFIYKGKVALDYANVPQAETLDRVHRWSVIVSF
jgi:opacity protein-like surface antigen